MHFVKEMDDVIILPYFVVQRGNLLCYHAVCSV
jgi:hypothetical protein